MRFFTLIFLLYSTITVLNAQTEPQTIKIGKEEIFVKAAFDEADYKVIAFDKYGNPHLNAIKSFCIVYSEGKNNYEAPVIGNQFPDKTVKFLTKKRETATKICLTKLKAEASDGHLEDLPDLCGIVIFPDCKKTNKTSKK